jgi:uncharacterized protein
MATYNILSLDGGGIRGVLTASILERLEADCPGFMSKIDLFAGTSTGGILALGLASGLNPTQARELYERSGSRVFAPPAFHLLAGLHKLDQWVEADYANHPLKEVLSEEFGSQTLGELKKSVLVTSFALDNKYSGNPQRQWKPKIFNNLGQDPDRKEKVVDVALRTSAAPTYFPVYQGFVDGGVVANNPTMCAFAQAISQGESGAKQTDDNIRILSVGTGVNLKFIEVNDENENWGFIQWIPQLISLILDGSVDLVNYQCRQIMGEKYLRLNPVIYQPISLDDVGQIGTLKKIAQGIDPDIWSQAVNWVNKNFM